MNATIEIFRNGRWTPAASLKVLGPGRCVFDYLPEYIFSADPVPVGLEVGFVPKGRSGMGRDRGAQAVD